MTDVGSGGARLADLVRPARLFAGIADRPAFVAPVALLVVAFAVYTQTAVGPALPRVIPHLLDRSYATQEELVRTFRLLVLAVSFFGPILFVAITAVASWLVLVTLRGRQPFALVLSLVSHAALWIAIGLLVRTVLVLISGTPEPSTNLAYFVKPRGVVERVVFSLTNPFAILAAAWSAFGLRSWGATVPQSAAGGALPWILWVVVFAAGAGSTSRIAPTTPVSYEGWSAIEGRTLRMLAPPDRLDDARELATILDGFVQKLAGRYEFTPRVLRVYALPDHATLERAAGEFLHVRTMTSVRGEDLVYVELPGMSAAFTRDRSIREAMRVVGLMQLRHVGAFRRAPAWFLEGLAHAAAIPGSAQLEADYESVLRRVRPSGLADFEKPGAFRTHEGPILARSVLDHLAYRFGPEVLDAIVADLAGGEDFRDALFEPTRLTIGALETGWLETIGSVLAQPPAAAPDSAESGDWTPFRPRTGR